MNEFIGGGGFFDVVVFVGYWYSVGILIRVFVLSQERALAV